jgi:hypothetical protein
MAINFTWTYDTLDVQLTDGSLQNVVTSVNWSCVGVDADTGASLSSSGSVGLGPPDPNNFIQYDDLSYDDVLAWVSASMDTSGVQTQVGNDIDSIINSGIVTMLPPFSN